MANTNILIKRSLTTGKPSSLQAGEFAYSYQSNTLFIGSPTGNGVVNVGGQYYTSTIDASTNANNASTLVKRDGNGAFYGRLFGVSNTAVALDTAQNFSISGGDISATAVSFNGTGAVTLNAALNSVPGLSAGYYGGSTTGSSVIPVVQVAANGRIMSIANTTVTSSFTISDGSNTDVVNSGETLTFSGTKGITTAVTNNQVTLGTDNTVLRANTTSVGPQTISSDLTVAGNLIVSGTQTYVNSQTVQTNDSLLKLAANNLTGDVVDIGFYGASNPTGSQVVYHGLIREGSGGTNAGKYFLFNNLTTDPTGNTVNYAGLNKADLYAGLLNGTSLSISGTTTLTGQANTTNDLGIGGNIYGAGKLVVTGTTTLTGQANTTNDLGVGGNTYVTGNERIGGTLNVTGATTLVASSNTTNDLGIGGNLYVTGTLAASNTTLGNVSAYSTTVTNGLYSRGAYNGSYTDGIVVDYVTGNGRLSVGTGDGFTFYNNTDSSRNPLFAISSSGNITTGVWQATTIGTAYGGTGATSFTTNGIVFGGSSLSSTAAAGTSDQTWSNQILTVTNAGVPVWSTALDGGTF
jgi:hypothetical protein